MFNLSTWMLTAQSLLTKTQYFLLNTPPEDFISIPPCSCCWQLKIFQLHKTRTLEASQSYTLALYIQSESHIGSTTKSVQDPSSYHLPFFHIIWVIISSSLNHRSRLLTGLPLSLLPLYAQQSAHSDPLKQDRPHHPSVPNNPSYTERLNSWTTLVLSHSMPKQFWTMCKPSQYYY